MYARELLANPESVPELQCLVPDGAELNERGIDLCKNLRWHAEHNDTCARIRHYCFMSPSLFTKNAHIVPQSVDLVIVGAQPRNTITSCIVLREGDFVLTNSGSIYGIADEATEEKLVRLYPMLVYDMVKGTPERERIMEVSKRVFPQIPYKEDE